MAVLRNSLIGLALLVCAGVAVAYVMLTASRASLHGQAHVTGLQAPVQVHSDALAAPRIEAASADDAWRALGFLVTRERAFQMDLMRRSAAGRLAELFGSDLLEADRSQRLYGFAQVASAVVQRLPEAQRARLAAYADGVNEALQASVRAPELYALGYTPDAWQSSDSILVVLGMFQALSNSESQERTRTVVQSALPGAVSQLLLGSSDPYTQSLITGSSAQLPALTSDERIALSQLGATQAHAVLSPKSDRPPVGSNAWVVAGWKSGTGRALLANDMHLDLGVPNTWYKAELLYGDVHLTGVVLPGVPALIAGSNEHIAWGITNLEGDNLDLVSLERRDEPFEVRQEVVHVRGAADSVLRIDVSRWGPVAPAALLEHKVALHWAAMDPAAIDLSVIGLERARDVETALTVMSDAGMPPSNFLVADSQGHIGWTVSGRMPKRHGFDGGTSVDWHATSARWDGYLSASELPRSVDPPSGMIVSANQRMLAEGAQLGHDFGHGYRAYRITEALNQGGQLDEQRLLQVQLDTRAELYEPYRQAALASAEATKLGPLAATLRAWDGQAQSTSRGFALVDRFRSRLIDAAYAHWLSRCELLAPGFALDLSDVDTPLQRVLAERDLGLLGVSADGWDAFIASVLERAAAELRAEHGSFDVAWGAVNRVQIAHPLSMGVSALSFLDMPNEPLSGCGYCVRLASHTLGASQRLVVSPGHEARGIMHMPGGQSGHPLSAHYDDQQAHWVEGRALPLRSSKSESLLTLTPH
jgi:penicillin G amidase